MIRRAGLPFVLALGGEESGVKVMAEKGREPTSD
jgi:hypothetical protein